MKRILYSLLLLVAISSCKGNEQETIDFDDLSKPSAKYKDQKDSIAPAKKTAFYYDSISGFSRQLVDSLGYDRNAVFKLDTLIFPDRFGALQTDKWYYLSPVDSLVFMRWQFKNEIKSENTFFNWLDCYGKNCKSIGVGDKVAFSRRATLFLQQGKELIFVESKHKINAEKMLAFLGNLKKEKQWKYFVLQAPGGKAVWKTVDAEGVSKDLEVNPVQE